MSMQKWNLEENVHPQKNLFKNDYGNIIHNTQKVCQLKSNVIYPYNGILCGDKEELSTDVCCNMNEP